MSEKEPSIYELARRRIGQSERQVIKSMTLKSTEETAPKQINPTLKRHRRYNENHADEIRQAAREWRERFEKKFGIKASTYYYKVRTGKMDPFPPELIKEV